jgi:Exostosin family
MRTAAISTSKARLPSSSTPNKVELTAIDYSNLNQIRNIKFLFSGRLRLWIPDRVCSLRNAIVDLATRKDTLILNITESETYSKVIESSISLISTSIFCIITRSDSYSSSFFYNAIQSGCLPIVVSDWYTFAYPWLIPYKEFVIRINKIDFLKDSHGVLNIIGKDYTADRILSMRSSMQQIMKYLQ